jgi:hypothetical protein
MSKFELTKSIEATKLNLRTGIPTSDPPVTIPFGAIVQDPVVDRDFRKFTYLGQRYRCADEMFRIAAAAISEPDAQPAPASATEPVESAPAAQELAAEEPASVAWERLGSNWLPLMRTKVPGGWLVALGDGTTALAFYPDPDHHWR